MAKGFKADGSYSGRVFKKNEKINLNENHWNWQGGVSQEDNYEFYWRIEWKRVRDEVMARDLHLCCYCNSAERITVHHIKDRKDFPKLAYKKSNLITLCRSCHTKADKHKETNPEILKFINMFQDCFLKRRIVL